MDISKFTSDELIAALPIGREDNQWELKQASALSKAERGNLDLLLGRQVSAFANSGGGRIVFGITDDGKPEACEPFNGRQPMKDFLSTMVEKSVDHPLRDFRIHEVPLTAGTGSLFVVEVGDSIAAPHQCKTDKVYYYRIDGHTKPAPHFYVTLLHDRMTKAVLAVEVDGFRMHCPAHGPADADYSLTVTTLLSVRNESHVIASPYGIRVVHKDADHDWYFRGAKSTLRLGHIVRKEPPDLFPSTEELFEVELMTSLKRSGPLRFDQVAEVWNALQFTVQPVSQNYAGQPLLVVPKDQLSDGGKQMMNEVLESQVKIKEAMREAFRAFLGPNAPDFPLPEES